MRFTRAIVRPPGRSFIHGLSTAGLGPPDHDLALRQHAAYVDALRTCGLQVITLPPDERYPDSTFVEDTALLTPSCAVILRPGAASRCGETLAIEPVVREFYDAVEHIEPPGTVDGGDIMMVGDHYFIGRSARTNDQGAAQLLAILNRHGYTGSLVPLADTLHLKSDMSYVENETVVAFGKLTAGEEFGRYRAIPVDPAERYAANCLWINGTVLIAAGHPKTARAIAAVGYDMIELDMSEYRKLDGGLSCLSLRF